MLSKQMHNAATYTQFASIPASSLQIRPPPNLFNYLLITTSKARDRTSSLYSNVARHSIYHQDNDGNEEDESEDEDTDEFKLYVMGRD